MIAAHRPLIGITACRRGTSEPALTLTAEKYVKSVIRNIKGLPVIMPSLEIKHAIALVEKIDGLYLPGSPTNIHPSEYGQEPIIQGPWDAARDKSNLCLIRHAIQKRIPILGICRGLQEINVALGGTLHQAVDDRLSSIKHSSSKLDTHDQKYRPAHKVNCLRGGTLEAITGQSSFITNSAHSQAIDRLAPMLQAEAWAEDNIIEAVSLRGSETWLLGVQWHPEWPDPLSKVSGSIFSQFGIACLERARRKQSG